MKEKKDKHFIKQPSYLGGPKALTEFIYKNLKYPQEAFTLGIEGIVFLEIEIDYQGNVKDTRILQGLGHGCNEEATRVAKLLKFTVGRNRGVKVLFHKKMKFNFKIPQKIEEPELPIHNPATVQYNYVPTAPVKIEDAAEKPTPQKVYSYTIKLQ